MKIKNFFGFSDREKAEKHNPVGTPPLPDPPQWQWRSHGLSDVGHRRKINEDAFLERPEIGLWMVADGMGGHQAGDVASSTLVATLTAVEAAPELETQAKRVALGIEDANDRLHQISGESLQGQIIGSTVVALVAKGLHCAAIWAGDSRLYRYRGGQLEQLTTDHSLLDELIRAGLINVEEASADSSGNIITRAVGAEAEIELDSIRFEAAAGDLYLLCSDGLAKELGPAAIAAQLEADSLEACARGLIDAALSNGGRDNITVVLIRPEARQAG